MDKDINDMASNDHNFDSDAEELLRDLDDDNDDVENLLKDLDNEDDSEYDPVLSDASPSRSLVNMLSSSADFGTVSTASSQSASTPVDAPAHDEKSDSENTEETPEHSTDSEPSDACEKLNDESSADHSAPQKISAADSETKEKQPNSDDSSDEKTTETAASAASPLTSSIARPAAQTQTPIPAAVSAPAAIPVPTSAATAIPAPIPPASPASSSPSAPPVAPVAPAHATAAASAHTDDKPEKNDPSVSASKRPPVPAMPKVPAAPAFIRGLRENETAYTQDALNDILPGGKNDDGRDLAYKFDDNNWYAQIFNEDFLRTVPKSSPRQSRREAKFICDRMGIQTGARVLDLCCGFGRHTIELSAKGFDMVGLDLSMVMLKKALADATARKLSIKFVHGDMRKLTFNSIFDAVYNVDTSFGYFDDLSNFKVLQGIARALKPGGVFLLETVNRDFIVNELPLRLWWKGSDCTLLEEIDLDPLSGVLKIQRSFVFDASLKRAPWEQKIQIRLYSVPEMRNLLSRAGFSVVELSGDYSLPGAYFGASSPKNIFVAEKPVK